MRAKRSFLNLFTGIGSQIITISLGIFIPRLLLVNFGSEVNGLVVSISQIIVYFSLLEAGVGAASLQALYKPAADGDKNSINEILAATSSYYKKTGIFYFFAVILLSAIYPMVIHSNINKATVMLVILFTGLGGAFNYYFQGKYKILLMSEGKNYIITSISTIINILSNLAKIVLLLLGFNMIAVQASFFILTLVQILIFIMYINRNYNWINLSATPNFKAISHKNSALIHQISSLVFSNTDVLILTLFSNLRIVSVYVLYNMVFTMVETIASTVNGSITFLLGQSYQNNKSKFMRLFNTYEVYYMAFVFSLFTITYILILPFMKLYTSGIDDINYIDKWLPVLFISIKLLINARSACNNIINIAGHFKQTQIRSISETIINIVLSIVFVNLLGIYGVLLGTLVAVIYRTIDIIIYTNKYILGRNPWVTVRRWLTNVGCFIVLINISNGININPTSYKTFIIFAVILTVILLPIYFIFISIFERESFRYTKSFFYKRLIKNNVQSLKH
ncbi:sugar isomerase [Neobacillus piezotolerans]|uniref:Sugar isomerase n=1 Tax=Neobacillus piezotolerans TaxID=2259171 RepID=A0A3D8GS87_9BACI|nr:sugar isomerase [Neobacillus piezotolerans]RDU37121.1 sugar isomerase [Neobacillus piezotolerans]